LSIGFVGTVTSQYEEDGVPFLRTVNVKPYEIIADDIKRITMSFHLSQKKSILKSGDIAMVHTGNPGICCVIDDDYDNSNCIDMIVIKPYTKKVNAYYLEAYMNSVGFKHIANQQVGCVQKHFNLKDAVDFPVYLPDITIQNCTGEFIKSLNDLILKNKKVMKKLETLIDTIYDYWFHQYEFPNNEGRPYASSGGQLVWNDLIKRMIPIGWNVQTLRNNNLCSVMKPGVDVFDQKVYLATADVDGIEIGEGNIINYETREGRANMQPQNYSVWFAKLKSSIKHIYLNNELNDFFKTRILSTGFCGLQCTPDSFEYIASFVGNRHFEITKDILAHGATMEGINNDDLNYIKLVIPDDQTLGIYHEIVAPSFSLLNQCISMNENLVALRNWLYPMIMSGQVKIDKSEEF
jgi:type I restriction enzyme S subunit